MTPRPLPIESLEPPLQRMEAIFGYGYKQLQNPILFGFIDEQQNVTRLKHYGLKNINSKRERAVGKWKNILEILKTPFPQTPVRGSLY